MNTSEALESMTDRGKFENLVTSILRKTSKEYSSIIQTGVNIKGETIKSPVDGFCLVPGKEPHLYLIVQSTTTEKNDIERKWLHSDSGDLAKSGKLADKIRKGDSDAEFIVILATNHRLDVALLNKVYDKAKEIGITCDIWEQSRLVDFLDTTPEGHWLRMQYLDIAAELLSKSLLSALCKQNLEGYKNEILLYPNPLVPREVEDWIRGGIENSKYTIHLLVGESGFGKSIASYKVLKEHLDSSGYGLWAPADLIKECVSIESLIDKILRVLYPRIELDAGRKVLQIVDTKFLIIIDDINRTDSPSRLLKKIFTWSRQQYSVPDIKQSRPKFQFVCPVWVEVMGIVDDEVSRVPWVHTVYFGPMSSKEGENAVLCATSQADLRITNVEAKELASKMGNDPIIIGLFSYLLNTVESSERIGLNLSSLAEDVVEKFLQNSVKETATNTPYLPNEYRQVLNKLCLLMLYRLRLNPSWEEILEWLKDSSDVEKLRQLIRHGKICQLKQEKITFRHDRIQETLLVESMISILRQPTPNFDIISEPFFSRIVGRAILLSPQNQDFITELKNRNPLVLFEAIRSIGFPITRYHRMIVEAAKEWWRDSVKTNSAPESLVSAACWRLLGTDSTSVLEITDSFPEYHLVSLARLRNGCAKSGALYCSRDFSPSISDSLRDEIIEHAKQKHGDRIKKELEVLLTSSKANDKDREGYLSLAGFLGFNFSDQIALCWKLVKDKERVLPEAIWAAIHCYGSEPAALLNSLMDYWEGLSDEETSNNMSPKIRIADHLHFALARGIRNEVANYLIQKYDLRKSLHWPILYMCDHVDDPDIIEFIVRKAADIERELRGTDKFSPWVHMLRDNWDTSLSGRQKLSQTSLDRLKILWENDSNDELIREQAFDIWLTGTEPKHIEILKKIPSKSTLFLRTLRKRAQLGDQTVVPNLIQLLSENRYYLFDVVHYIWCDELKDMVDKYLNALDKDTPKDFSGGWSDVHHFLSRLLMMIPNEDAEYFLNKHWEYIGYSPLFIQTALYVGTRKCLELADFSIKKCPSHIKLFEHIHFQFGFGEFGRSEKVNQKHIDNLLPYLDRFGESELWNLAEECQRLGIPEWGRRNLVPRLSENWKKIYYPSDDDLLQDLDKFSVDKHGIFRVSFWLEDFNKRHEPREKALAIIDYWLSLHPTLGSLRIVAACIQIIGTRNDLAILEKYKIEGSNAEITSIILNARYAVQIRSLD